MTNTLIDPAARRVWDSYFTEVDRLLVRAGAVGTELRADLEAHVADSMAADPAPGSETERLQRALDRLGRPLDYLRPMLADALIERGGRTYNPLTIARGLGHALRAGSSRAATAFAFVLGYAFLVVFAAMAALKPVWGDHVGLFRYADGALAMGIMSDTAGAEELLGWWSVPIAMVIAALLYAVLTRALRTMRAR